MNWHLVRELAGGLLAWALLGFALFLLAAGS